eukprot:TRINITY_DN23767_c0_g1_i1.p1 TRINITY_DN23767_c0_g1~~TRINITY_DN23767_c0_g1_i1.p1  ORF type:complete len:192 (+),score=26.61 TRINITY_DN23767_c0_g1_i1:156-731(+)
MSIEVQQYTDLKVVQNSDIVAVQSQEIITFLDIIKQQKVFVTITGGFTKFCALPMPNYVIILTKQLDQLYLVTKDNPKEKKQFQDCCNNVLSLCASGEYNSDQIVRNDGGSNLLNKLGNQNIRVAVSSEDKKIIVWELLENGNFRHSYSIVDTQCCLLYTSDAADEEDSVDLGGRRIIKKKQTNKTKYLIE